jgi:hypothetical protein
MFILVPWKPVALIVVILGALVFVGYVGSSLMQGRNPFGMPAAAQSQIISSKPAVAHATTAHRNLHKAEHPSGQ